ncbi:MAG: alpha/beta hydrolase [Piscirickettsiaceae bacterium]|nr:MAG: alpha/beta hydrolase [Piscirickettsiaceae bacterium]
MRHHTRLFGVFLILALSGCSSLNTLNTIIPDGDSTLVSSLTYGLNNRQKLDIYLPSTLTKKAPVIIFFYGGRWQSGAREEYAFVGQALANRGFITVIPDYRLYPEVEFPGFITDAATATDWVLKHIKQYGGDSSQAYLMGHSAGAHIAAMLVTNTSYLSNIGVSNKQIKGLISLSGPLNFKITDDDIKKVFSAASQYSDTQPITFVDGSEPNMLLLHGAKDKTLWPANSISMAEKVNRLGGHANIITYKDMSHVGLLLALANAPFLYFAPVLDDIEAFIKQKQTITN